MKRRRTDNSPFFSLFLLIICLFVAVAFLVECSAESVAKQIVEAVKE